MEDIVGVRLRDDAGRWHGFITWGRIIDAVDHSWVENVVQRDARKRGIEGIVEVIICKSLREVANYEYFCEALFSFANAGISFGPSYEEWRAARQKGIDGGVATVYYLGRDLGCICHNENHPRPEVR